MNLNKKEEKQTVFKDDHNVTDNSNKKSSTGLDQNIAGLLCYLLGFLTGILFLVLEKENKFVRYHAFQSIIVSVAIFIISMVLTAIPVFGWMIGILLSPVSLIIWIFLMVKAYQNTWYKFPMAGDIAMKQVKDK